MWSCLSFTDVCDQAEHGAEQARDSIRLQLHHNVLLLSELPSQAPTVHGLSDQRLRELYERLARPLYNHDMPKQAVWRVEPLPGHLKNGKEPACQADNHLPRLQRECILH